MKQLKTIFKCIFLCTIILTMATSCSKDDGPTMPASISISPVNKPLEIGDTKQLEATILPEDSIDKSITWLSSDIEIATVDINGLVTCINSGDVIIQASTSNDIKKTVNITISKPKFIMPTEFVGNWVGVEFALVDKESGTIYDEAYLKEAFMSDEDDPMTEEEFEEWIISARANYEFVAKADGTMEWPVDVRVDEAGTIERIIVNGILTPTDTENTYIGTFNKKAAGLVGDIVEYEFVYEEPRIKAILPWNNNYSSIIYYNVVKSSSKKSNMNKISILAPELFRRK